MNPALPAGLSPAWRIPIRFANGPASTRSTPFLNVFLITQQGWSQSAVGLVTTVSGLLGLVGQELAQANPGWATAMMSACIIAAQLVMLPVALLAGRYAARWGRKPVLLIGFGILPLRAVLYTLALGVVVSAQAIGASVSSLAAGLVVDHFGYNPAFLALGAAAAVALAALLLLPETGGSGEKPDGQAGALMGS